MTVFLFVFTLCLMGIIVVGFPLYLILMLDMLIRGHDLPTSKRAKKVIFDIIRQHKKDASILYDLGCARGSFAVAVKKTFPHFTVHAIDNSALRLFFAKIKAFVSGQEVIWQKADIFNVDLQNADIIYTYLWYDLMPSLEKKLQKELKKGALVITNTSHFSQWEPVKIYNTYKKNPEFEQLFVYIKN